MGSTTWWGKEIIDCFEAGNRHLEAVGGVLCCIPSPGWISNVAPFLIQAQKGLRCNWSAVGLQVVAPGRGAEQRPSSKQTERNAPAPSQGLAELQAGEWVQGWREVWIGSPTRQPPRCQF